MDKVEAGLMTKMILSVGAGLIWLMILIKKQYHWIVFEEERRTLQRLPRDPRNPQFLLEASEEFKGELCQELKINNASMNSATENSVLLRKSD